MNLDNDQRKEFRDYLWKYFSMHADQRLKAFNFYIVVSAIFSSGHFSLQAKDASPDWAFALPLLLAFTSFVFWKLDVRTKQMIKLAEDGLKLLDREANIPLENAFAPLYIFQYDDDKTLAEKKIGRNIFIRTLSYSKCFNLIFATFGAIGLLAAAHGGYRVFMQTSQSMKPAAALSSPTVSPPIVAPAPAASALGRSK